MYQNATYCDKENGDGSLEKKRGEQEQKQFRDKTQITTPTNPIVKNVFFFLASGV